MWSRTARWSAHYPTNPAVSPADSSAATPSSSPSSARSSPANCPSGCASRLPPTRSRAPQRRRPSTRHGPEFKLDQPDSQPEPAFSTSSDTDRYGAATATAWHRAHPRLTRRGAWARHDSELPIVEGTLIRLTVDRLPGDRDPKPLWLWHSRPEATPADMERLWRKFLRRFDIEHTFRFLKQTLGWTRPRVRTPDQGDRWTWLIIAAHTQLRLARVYAGANEVMKELIARSL